MSETGPTIGDIPEDERPATICTTCPVAMWYRSSARLRCFCREMRVVSWEDGDKDPILQCDGREAALNSDHDG